MCTLQHRNLSLKKQSTVSFPKSHKNTTESNYNELAEMSDRGFKSLLLKMINDIKEDSNKQKNKVKKSCKI
jgi:predicted RNA-binding protein with RPS1 domain